MEFEWDPRKAAANVRKHNVAFQEEATVFGDLLAITFEDPDHSMNENRYITFDVLVKNRHSGGNRSPENFYVFEITGFRLSPE